MDISTIPLGDYSASDKAELITATGYALQAAVHLMSTQSFSEALLWLLDLEDLTIQASALALLRNRLPTIKAVRRGDISPAVVNVVERIRLSLADPTSNTEEALATLDVIATSVWAEEDSALAKAVPDLLVVANASSTASKATKALAMGIVKQLAYVLARFQGSGCRADTLSPQQPSRSSTHPSCRQDYSLCSRNPPIRSQG